jgi:very-short-patch-repair endonuclease
LFPLSPCGRGWLARRASWERGVSLARAKQLREKMTDAERRLWYRLRAHRFGNAKFKRQAPLGPYIVDFVCFERNLVVEVDGGQHAENSADRARDAWLKDQGFEVLHFWNNDVLRKTDAVLEIIAGCISEQRGKVPSPGALRAPPSPTGGEGKKEECERN